MLAQLQGEPLAAQFVPVKIATDEGDDWPAWRSRYPYEGDTIPIVFIVRADGEMLYGQSGTPPALRPFLARHLSLAGKLLNERQLTKMANDAELVQKLLDEEETERAVGLAVRNAGSGSYADAARYFDDLVAELADAAMAALEDARQKLESDDEPFAGALAFVETERLYGRIPEVVKAAREARGEYRKEKAIVDRLRQAEHVDKGKSHESQTNLRSALAAYQGVLKTFPDTPAAEFAAGRIAELEKEGAVLTDAAGAAADSPAGRADAPALSDDEKRAASQVRLGKQLISRNPAKAREYFERAIELAPDSDAAAEARALLER